MGRGKEDTITRYAATPILEDREEPRQISENYRELWNQNVLSSFQGILCNKINSPRIWESSILKYSPKNFNLEGIDKADITIVDRPWLVPFIENKVENGQVLVYSSHNVESELYSHLKSNWMFKRIHRRISNLEEYALSAADLTVAMSKRDKLIHEKKYGKQNSIYVAPAAGYRHNTAEPGTQVTANTELPFSPEGTSLVACFVGNDHYPNVEAVREILNIANLKTQSQESVEFLVIGDVCNRFKENKTPENVHLLGFVESLQTYYSVSDVALNPVQSGSGVNIKMLEYFQNGLATISTPFGARGIEAKPGIHYIESETEYFSDALSRLSKDPERANNIASNAKGIIRNKLNWTDVSQALFNRLRQEV